MAGQFNIPGLAKNVFIKKGPEIDPGFLNQIFSNEPQPQQLNSWSNYRPNLSERAEQINKAIEDWQAAKSKQTIEGVKRGAAATGKAVKGGINYIKPIAQLGGKALGVGADVANVGQLIASDDPFDKWAAGVGLTGSALQKASIPLAATGFGAPLAPWVYGAGTAMQFGGAAAPYVKDWVENKNREREANRASERQFLEEELRRRGLL